MVSQLGNPPGSTHVLVQGVQTRQREKVVTLDMVKGLTRFPT